MLFALVCLPDNGANKQQLCNWPTSSSNLNVRPEAIAGEFSFGDLSFRYVCDLCLTFCKTLRTELKFMIFRVRVFKHFSLGFSCWEDKLMMRVSAKSFGYVRIEVLGFMLGRIRPIFCTQSNVRLETRADEMFCFLNLESWGSGTLGLRLWVTATGRTGERKLGARLEPALDTKLYKISDQEHCR